MVENQTLSGDPARLPENIYRQKIRESLGQKNSPIKTPPCEPDRPVLQ